MWLSERIVKDGGDIRLQCTTDRLLSVAIMIFGLTLCFNLARAVLRPHNVRFECCHCGLMTHDLDALHCKACGKMLPNEAAY